MNNANYPGIVHPILSILRMKQIENIDNVNINTQFKSFRFTRYSNTLYGYYSEHCLTSVMQEKCFTLMRIGIKIIKYIYIFNIDIVTFL